MSRSLPATRRAGLALLAAAIAAGVVLFGGALRSSPEANATAAGPVAAVESHLQAGFGAGDTTALVADLQERARARPSDAETLTLLGLAYQQRYRETADASYLSRSDGVLRQALAVAPRAATAVGAVASLSLSRHEFHRALTLGRRALRLNPGDARSYGIIGDALVELGRYEEAFRAFDTMARLRPSLPAYARIAYGRELIGRPRRAIESMRLALASAGAQPEPNAWAHVELAKLHFSLGELEPAARHARAALTVFPGYVHAFEVAARIEAARGHMPAALRYARRAAESVPLPQFVATLGDLYRASGRKEAAREQYAVIGAIERILRANGVRTDLETALFDVDHGLKLEEALKRAREARAERPSIQADDVLAWALARAGRCGEALRSSKRALRLGTRDAPSFFHRGMIERCLGRDEAARAWFRRALALNPHFSIVWAPVARRYA